MIGRTTIRMLAWGALVSALAAGGCATPSARQGPAPDSAPRAAHDGPATSARSTPRDAPSDLPPGAPDPARAAYFNEIDTSIAPPAGWRLDRKPQSKPNVRHWVWVSPSGHTALGVMRFALPIPVPHDPVIWVFLSEMRRAEGEARLLSKRWDPDARAVRFEAEGGRYIVRTRFTLRGLRGWMVYAGTLREAPVNEGELREAESARDAARVGPPPG